MISTAAEAAKRLADYAEKHNYAGFDPYDLLNSPLSGALSLGIRLGRIALTQFGRRSPINFRPLLFVRPGVNPKALALFLEGTVKLFRAFGDERDQCCIEKLVQMLAENRSPNVSGSAWGYNFPWQNRFQCLPRYTPTIVNSAFAGHALLDCYETTGNEKALELAKTIPDFILKDLNRKTEGDTFCFSYTPLDTNFVHNANMLGASLLTRLAVKYNRSDLLDPAQSALAYSMKYQHEDGSWAYAETEAQKWIDSFHTGFNLEALRRFLELGLVPGYQQAYEKGVKFYAENFFLQDGTPKYFHDHLYLVDIHAPAEAITFFSGEGKTFRPLIEKILDWTFANMYDKNSGLFYFRKAKHFTIKIPYMRWSEAWAFRAMCTYLLSFESQRRYVNAKISYS